MIRDIEVRPVLVPMPHPHRTASGVITESPLVLLTLHTEEGVAGQSITFTYTAAALQSVADLLKNIGQMIVGDALAPFEIEQKLLRRFRLLGTQGLVGMALAGIDMAAWDALARLHNVPLFRLLGAEAKPLQAYGAIGYDGPGKSAEAAEDWANRGFRGVKAKIGYPSVREDLSTIRAIRSAVGPDIAIMVDYNQCLTPAEAVERLRLLEDEGLTWVEEPTLAHDFEGHAQIANAIGTPIQCGENWWGALDMRHAIQAHAADYMMVDLGRIGGVSGWQRAAALAAAHGIPLSSHLWPEVSAQLLCATPTAHWLEYADWWNPIVEEPLRIENGLVSLEGVTGSGVRVAQR